MTEVNTNEVEVQEAEKMEFDFLKEITLVNAAGAEKTITAPKVVPGHVHRKAISLKYKNRKLMFKNDGNGKYEHDEEGNFVPNEMTEEIELGLIENQEQFAVEYFNNQFTLEELRDGLDARVYQETLDHIYYSALGNPTVPVKK